MEQNEFLLADIAVLRLHCLSKIGIAHNLSLLELWGREHIRTGEYRLPAQGSDPGLFQGPLLSPDFFRLAPSGAGSHELAP